MTAVEERPASQAPAASSPSAPRGWYADPAGCHQYRFWDGLRWTPGVSDQGFVREDPLPDHPCAPEDARARPPLRAVAIGLAGLLLGGLVSVAVALAFHAWSPEHKALALALSQAGLWAGMMGAVVLVSRRYGSGHLRRDYGLSFRWVDIGWGLLLAIVARALAAVITVVVLLGAGRSLHGQVAKVDTARLVVLCVLLVVGAPLIEEIFFRGLMLRSFQTRLRTPLAIGAQAVLFSACHALTATGVGLVSELLSTLLFGVLAGAVVTRFRRLGPTIVAHSLFNLVVAAVLIAAST